MIKAIFTIMNINVSKKINGFLYFLKKIPIIKKLFINRDYSLLGLKKFLSVISIIHNIIWGPIKFGLFYYLIIYLPIDKFLDVDVLSSIMLSTFLFLFLFNFLSSEIMSPSQEKFIIVKQMKMSPRVFAISKIISDNLIGVFSRSLVLGLIFQFSLGKGFLSGVKIALASIMFGIFTEAIHLYLYKKTGFVINKFVKTTIAVFIGGVAVTYSIIIFTDIAKSLNLYSILSNSITTIAFIILGIIGFRYLYKYDRYWDVLNEENKSETFKVAEESLKDINFQEVKLKDKDFNEKTLKENDKVEKEGYDYLNYIFFKRHRRLVSKPMMRKSIVVIGIFLAIFIGDKFFKKGLGKELANELIDNYTMLVFVVYMICNSTSIIKSFFYSCDRSFLRYGFYKRGDALLNMFFLRLKKILLTNMLPIILLCIGIIQLTYFNAHDRISAAIPMVICTILLAMLFSVHYIFIYYMFQPFTTDLQTKNPFYNIINFLVYMVSYILIQTGWSAMKILPYLLGVFTVYISLAIVLVYKKAPKTFRVK